MLDPVFGKAAGCYIAHLGGAKPDGLRQLMERQIGDYLNGAGPGANK